MPKLKREGARPVGNGSYLVRQGECLSSIAHQHGFFPDTIWNHPENATLKRIRKDPKVLLPGDGLHVPALELREENCATEKLHSFRRRGFPEYLQIVLRDESGQPRPDLRFHLTIDGVVHTGRTAEDGVIRRAICPTAYAGELVIFEDDCMEEYQLLIGHLDPIETGSGVDARQHNLGHRETRSSSDDSDALASQIQREHGF